MKDPSRRLLLTQLGAVLGALTIRAITQPIGHDENDERVMVDRREIRLGFNLYITAKPRYVSAEAPGICTGRKCRRIESC